MYAKYVFAVGLILALIGAYLMYDGQLLGENTTGVATVLSILGIGLIATSGGIFAQIGKKKQ